MESQRLCLLDRISNLPQNLTEYILTLMPIRDALRTSILSTKWRYSWRSMPKLVFTGHMVKLPSESHCIELKKYKLVNAIFQVLLLHNGPTTLEFYLSVREFEMYSEFDQIISHLSMCNNVKELIIYFRDGYYNLPASFFSIHGLERIHLGNCCLKPPLAFNGFKRLRSMIFNNVVVSAQMLQRFLSKCPLIEHISLGDNEDAFELAEEYKFTFVEFLRCVPLIRTFYISINYMEYLTAGGMPHELPTSLVHLKYLSLDVCFTDQILISSALCLIRSAPLLEKILIMMYDVEELPVPQTPTNFLNLDDYSDLKLDNLAILEMVMFINLPVEMEFVKLIMAKAPVLKEVRIELSDNVSVDEELKMCRDLVLLPFLRASPSAKLIIERAET